MHLSYRVCQTVKSTTTRNTAPHDHHQDTRRPVSPGDHRCGIHRPTTRASRFRKRFPPTTGAFKDSSIILPRIYWQDAHITYWRDSGARPKILPSSTGGIQRCRCQKAANMWENTTWLFGRQCPTEPENYAPRRVRLAATQTNCLHPEDFNPKVRNMLFRE